ncbi:hypothetical protein SBA7_340029 [Candidatus Sulfotelmatobacter sp. SbA7]|nr:hypothetical protein SBA7_340029 [Candidatus Sulfotelmatobacter sp. SbA7]
MAAKWKLNGWQRIGIVASTAWILYSYNTTFDRLNMDDAIRRVNEEQSCLAEHPGEFEKWFPVCDASSPKRESALLKRQQGYRLNAAIESTVPVPIVWGAAYLLLFIVRWIRKGFVAA